MYATGRGVAQNDALAVQWYRKAAERGNTTGHAGLGVMYRDGRGVAQDPVEAVTWFRKAADQGDAFAQNNLGVMYRDSRGVSQDDDAAVSWFRKAAEHGYAPAQDNLGGMYAQGRGVAQDDAEAVAWFRKGAEQGNAYAATNLAHMYEAGRGVAKDDAQALQWYRKAAEQGDSNARSIVSAIEERRDVGDLSRRIADLVAGIENAQPAVAVLDPERAALAHQVIEAAGLPETLSHLPDQFTEGMAAQRTPSNLPPRLLNAIGITAVASFRPERILASVERRLAETVDIPTLQAALVWEKSDLGDHINRLAQEAEKPEKRAAMQEYARQIARTGAAVNDTRARACAQVDIFQNETDSALPLIEALVAAGAMGDSVAKAQPLDLDKIRRQVISVRPLLREVARQSVLAKCLFELQDLSDVEFERWLEFLRSDSGGRYARAMTAAIRDALLTRTEIFTRTMIEVLRQLQGRAGI
jgi:TPR repeat protein